MPPPLYKILPAAQFAAAASSGLVPWSEKDREDGFMHLSTAEQVKETAAKHFAGQCDLVLLALDPSKLTELRFEPSRGGALFPHVYAEVSRAVVLRVHVLVGAQAGHFDWPPELARASAQSAKG